MHLGNWASWLGPGIFSFMGSLLGTSLDPLGRRVWLLRFPPSPANRYMHVDLSYIWNHTRPWRWFMNKQLVLNLSYIIFTKQISNGWFRRSYKNYCVYWRHLGVSTLKIAIKGQYLEIFTKRAYYLKQPIANSAIFPKDLILRYWTGWKWAEERKICFSRFLFFYFLFFRPLGI